MNRAYLLTGEPKIGKTTALKKVIEAIGIDRCGGFYTEEVRVQGVRKGFRFITLSGQTGVIADVGFESPIRVGEYGVSLDDLETIGVAVIYKAIDAKDFVVIDEIGPMQLYSWKFKQAVLDVLSSPKALVGTIVSRPHPWSDGLKQREEVHLHYLTVENRDDVAAELVPIILKSDSTKA